MAASPRCPLHAGPIGLMRSLLPLFVLASLLSACTNPLACTTEARAGISVNVIDAQMRVPIGGYRGIVRDGDYSDSLRCGAAAYERAGT